VSGDEGGRFKVGDRVQFARLGKFKNRTLLPPPAEGSGRVYEGDLATVVDTAEPRYPTVLPDGRRHSQGDGAGWRFFEELFDPA